MFKIKRNIAAIICVFTLFTFLFLGGFIAIAQTNIQLNFSKEIIEDLNEFDFTITLSSSGSWNKTFKYKDGKTDINFNLGYPRFDASEASASLISYLAQGIDSSLIIPQGTVSNGYSVTIEKDAPFGVELMTSTQTALLDLGRTSAEPINFYCFGGPTIKSLYLSNKWDFTCSYNTSSQISVTRNLVKIGDKYYFVVMQDVPEGFQSTIWRVDEFANKNETTKKIEKDGNVFNVPIPCGKFTKIADLPINDTYNSDTSSLNAIDNSLVYTEFSDGALYAKIYNEKGELTDKRILDTKASPIQDIPSNNGKDITFILASGKAIGLRVENGKFTSEIAAQFDLEIFPSFATMSRNLDKLMLITNFQNGEIEVNIYDKAGKINTGVTNCGAQDDRKLYFNEFGVTRYIDVNAPEKTEVSK